MEKREENLKKICTFLQYNFQIKKIMCECSPEYDDHNERNVSEYSDKLYNSLKDIEFYIRKMIELYPTSPNDIEYINKIFSIFYNKLNSCSSSYSKLKKFYNACISGLSEILIDEVASNCIGYTYRSASITKCSTINEIIHLLHQRIINNENIYASMPIINQKQNDIGEPIIIYGHKTIIGEKIFQYFPNELDVGQTDILSLSENKILLLIRDRGHALSIEVERENDKYYIRYFIPKICNVDMVNKIKGVRKVTYNSNYTTGIFETTFDMLEKDLVEFINKVPTDNDMYKEGGPLYDYNFASKTSHR